MSAVPQLSYLSDLGLVSGEDYLLREVSIQNGKITNLGTFMVPALEPGKLSFVNGENTSVSVNKSLVAAGQPVTVRVAYEIKEEYGSSGETLVIELPENCGIVAGSVVVNGKTVTYTETGNTVSIPTGYSSGTVLFYVSPSASGEFAVTCGLQFESSHSGKVLQPLGTGYFRATAMELQVLDRTARDTVVVSGKLLPMGKWKSTMALAWQRQPPPMLPVHGRQKSFCSLGTSLRSTTSPPRSLRRTELTFPTPPGSHTMPTTST